MAPTDTTPAGDCYDLGPMLVRRDKMALFTSDIERFERCLPDVRKLFACEPEDPAAGAVWRTTLDREGLLVTVAEVACYFEATNYVRKTPFGSAPTH